MLMYPNVLNPMQLIFFVENGPLDDSPKLFFNICFCNELESIARHFLTFKANINFKVILYISIQFE